MSSHLSPKLALIAFSFVLGACSFSFQAGTSARTRNQARHSAQPTAHTTTTATPQATTPTRANPTKTPPVVAEPPRITGKNAFGNGSIGAFHGKAYVIPNTTTTMPDLTKMVPFATLLTDNFIVQTQEFTGGFPGVLMQDEWFAIRFDGSFEIQADNTYSFQLISDDGAILYIDGAKVMDNDGLHAARTVLGSKVLKTGRHTLRLDYFQGARGPVALSLGIGPGAAAEQYHPLVGIR